MLCSKMLALLVSAFLLLSQTFVSASAPTQVHAVAHTTAKASTHTVRAASCPPTLSVGSAGSWVKKLQNTLNWDLHYRYFSNYPYNFHPYLVLDGMFGPKTKNAVRDFQYLYTPTEIDGIVGPHTWKALGYC